MLLCLIINALILGEVLNLVIIIYKDDTYYQEKLDTTNSLMTSHDFDPKLENEIRIFMNKTQNTGEKKKELEDFFEIISP